MEADEGQGLGKVGHGLGEVAGEKPDVPAVAGGVVEFQIIEDGLRPIRIDAAGHVPVDVRWSGLPEHTVRLVRARTLRVRVDGNGRELPPDLAIEMRVDGEPSVRHLAARESPDSFRFDRVPCRLATITCEAQHAVVVVAAQATEAVLVLER